MPPKIQYRRRTPAYLLFAFLVLMMQRQLAGRDIFVANGGSDPNGAGTIEAPYATLSRALSAARDGDTVLLRNGTYQGGVTVNTPRLTIRSYPGEWAAITAPTDDPGIPQVLRYNLDATGGWLHRVELIGGYDYALKFESNWDMESLPTELRRGVSNLLIEDCKIHDTGRDCIKITPGCDDITIRRCEIYNSGLRYPGNAEGIDNVNGDRMLVQDCYIHDITTNGLYPKGGAIGCIIERCLITDCGMGGIMVGFDGTDFIWFDPVANPGYHEAIDCIVRNNIILRTGGAGIGLYGSLRTEVCNNTIVDTGRLFHSGILLSASELYPPGSASSVLISNIDPVILNNILVQSAQSADTMIVIREYGLARSITINHNRYHDTRGAVKFRDFRNEIQVWEGDLAAWKKQIRGDSDSSEGDPQLDAGYHLVAGSPCIHAGLPVPAALDDYDAGARPSRYDIGADQYGTGSLRPVPPPPGSLGTAAPSSPSPTQPDTTTHRGGYSLQTQGASDATRVGYAQIQPNPAAPAPAGFAILELRSNGVLVTEVGITASPPRQHGRIFAQLAGDVDTGLALANQNDQPVTISFYFTDAAGENFGAGSTTIPARGQIARFLDQAPFNGFSPLTGTFTFAASLPICAVALRGLVNERSDFLATSMPVADLQAPVGEKVYFSHFADGGGWSTQLILINPGDEALNGALEFLGQGSPGTAAAPVTVTAGGVTGSAFAYALQPRTSWNIQTSGISPELRTGSVRVSPTAGTATPAGVCMFAYREAGITVTEAGVPALRPASALRMFAEMSSSDWSGLAVANPSPVPAVINYELTDMSGLPVGMSGSATIPGNGQLAGFIDQLAGLQTLKPPFSGILSISTPSPEGIAMVGLRGSRNERGDFLIAATEPAPENSFATGGELWLAHLADGGGYVSKIVLFSSTAGKYSLGKVRFIDQSGSPMNFITQ